jgi:hypothetical protein
MKQTPITTYDKRTFLVGTAEYRQVGTKPGFPIAIEKRFIDGNNWFTPNNDAMQTQESWEDIIARGKVVA